MDLTNCTTLSRFLETVPDLRDRQGQRHDWAYLLMVICMGLASGQKTPYAIFRWSKFHEKELVEKLAPSSGCTPGKSTFCRTVDQVDIDALEELIAKYGESVDEWMSDQAQEEPDEIKDWHAVSADGKEVRGAAKHGTRVCLVSLARHDSGITIGQIRRWKSHMNPMRSPNGYKDGI